MDNNSQKMSSCTEKVNIYAKIDFLFTKSFHRYFLFFVIFLFFLQFILLSRSADAAIAFRAASSAASQSATSGGITAVSGTFAERTSCGNITPSIPGGNVNDLLIAQVIARDNNSTVTMPGWNTLFSDNVAGADYQSFLFWRSATGTDPNTVNQTGTCQHLMSMITRFGNVDTVQPLETQPLAAANWVYSNNNNIDTGTQNITVSNSMLVLASFVADRRTVTEPGSFTELYDIADNTNRRAGFSLNYRIESATGTSGPFNNMGLSGGGNDPNHGVLFAVRPASSSVSALTISTPAGIQTNDVMTASIAYRPCSNVSGGACTTTIIPPAGWTLVRGIDTTTGGGTGGFGSRLFIYQRVATGSEPANYTWDFGGAPAHAGATGSIMSFSGVDTVSPIVADAGQATPNSYNHPTPSINTGSVTNTMLVSSHSVNSSGTWTPPAGMTEQVDISSLPPTDNLGIMLETNYQLLVAAGATGTRTAVQSNPPASDTGGTHILALRPGDSPPSITSTSGSCGTLNEVTVIFSEDVDSTTAETTSNYSLDNGVTINSATLTTGNTVTLSTSPLVDLTTYTLTVNNVEDLLGNAIIPDSTSLFSLNCSNLIAYYQLDEASWNGTPNEVVDQSGNGLHGAAVGGVTTSAAKVCNGAILDGITLSYVEVADNDLLDIPDELTVSLWMKTNVIPGSGLKSILSKDENYEFHIDSGGHIYWWWNRAGGGAFTLTSSNTVNVGQWHHIAIVYSSSGGYQKIYIDGVEDPNTNNRSESLMINTDPLQIGGDQGFATREFDGLIDEVRIYEKALSTAQIQADMNASHPCSAPVSCSFRDNFASVSYGNNDGTLPWAGNWLETNDNNSPVGGDAYISGGDLVLTNIGGNPRPAVTRELDLTAATSATLEFTFSTTAGVDNNDRFRVEVSGNGGASWTTLETIGNITGVSTQSRSYPIDSYINNNTQIRLSIRSRYNGANEAVHFYYVAVLPGGLCGAGPDHFAISHDGAGINCQAEPITISAHDGSHNIDGSYVGTITLSTSTSHGDWTMITGNPANLTNSSNGGATYIFDGSEAGTIVLGLKDTYVETVNINITDGSVTETSNSALPGEDADLVFDRSGFNFLAGGVKNAIGTQIAGKPSNIAPGNQTLELQAINTNDDTGVCEAALVGNNTIELAFECLNPATCTASQASINGTAIAGNNNGASPLSYTNVDLDFGNATDTTATFVLQYPDAGQIRLAARYDIPLDNGSATPSGNYMLGTSNNFVVRPFAFYVTATGNPAATGPAGSIFTSAGTGFPATVRAVQWQAVDDDDAVEGNDGIADGHNDTNPANNVDLSDNAVCLNYGQETTAESVLLSPELNQPSGGNNPALGGSPTFNTFVSGNDTSTIAYNEVGIIELVANVADNDYLGAGNVTGKSGYVGRFTPDHFDVTINPDPPSFADSCGTGNFTYLGDTFNFATNPVVTVTAKNSEAPTPATTQNYEGNFWKLGEPFTINCTYPETTTPVTLSPDNGTAGAAAGATANCNGTLSVTIADTFSYTRPVETSPVIPFAADVDLVINPAQFTDTDLVCYDIGAGCVGLTRNTITGANLRHGRLKVFNNFGPETEDITGSPYQIQYWDDFDGDTVYEWDRNANEDATNCTTEAVLNFCASPATHAVAIDPLTLVAGAGTLTVAKDAANTPETVRVCPIAPAHLTSLGVCTVANDMCGNFTFGVYRGNDRIINWQEIVR